jgi:hypothetical protein
MTAVLCDHSSSIDKQGRGTRDEELRARIHHEPEIGCLPVACYLKDIEMCSEMKGNKSD